MPIVEFARRRAFIGEKGPVRPQIREADHETRGGIFPLLFLVEVYFPAAVPPDPLLLATSWTAVIIIK